MTQEQLTYIIRVADTKAITKQLKELGYIFCNKDKKLRKVDIVELVNAIKDEAEDFVDEQPFDNEETAIQTDMLV